MESLILNLSSLGDLTISFSCGQYSVSLDRIGTIYHTKSDNLMDALREITLLVYRDS